MFDSIRDSLEKGNYTKGTFRIAFDIQKRKQKTRSYKAPGFLLNILILMFYLHKVTPLFI